MKRPSTVRLAIMGGGVLMAVATVGAYLTRDSDACRRAREANSPDAASVCQSSARSGSSYGSSAGGAAGAAASSASRGGFGASGVSAGP